MTILFVELVFVMTDEILKHQFDNHYLIQKKVLLQRVCTRWEWNDFR